MRLLALRGENLASLAEAFALDFEAPPLRGAGIIAITGPTGAGKSTLLDAICLALFDNVPRLAGSDKAASVGRDGAEEALAQTDVRALLRHGASRAWAEVDFEGCRGQRYRARWEVRRARGAASGRLQASSVTLRSLADGQIIGDKKKDTLARIETALGLSFEQFKRAVLLAQGEFDSFLRAPATDRAELLERITGATIYSALSKAAHERAKAEEQAIAALRAQAGEHVPLDDEARAVLDSQHQAAESALARLDAERQTLEARRSWRLARARHDRDAAAAAASCAAAARAIGDSVGERERLAALRRAALLRPLLDAAATSGEAYRRALVHRERMETAAEAMREERAKAASALQRARAAMAACAQDSLDELHACRLAADASRAEARSWLDDHAAEAVIAQRLDELLAALDEHGAASETARGLLASLGIGVDACGLAHAAAEARLADLRIVIGGIDRDALDGRETALRAAEEALREAAASRELSERATRQARAARDRAEGEDGRAAWTVMERQRLDEILAAARARLGEAERVFAWAEAAASDAAAELRATLIDGEPCPVCGARAHGALDPHETLRARREQDRLSLAGLRAGLEAGMAERGALAATMREAAAAAGQARDEAAGLDREAAREAAKALAESELAASLLRQAGLPDLDRVAIEAERALVRERLDERARAMEEADGLGLRLRRLAAAREALQLAAGLARPIDALLAGARPDWREAGDLAGWCRERARAWGEREARARESEQRLAALEAPMAVAITRFPAATPSASGRASAGPVPEIAARLEAAFSRARAAVDAAEAADRRAEMDALAASGRLNEARRVEMTALQGQSESALRLDTACREAGLAREAVAEATQAAIDAIEQAQAGLRSALSTAEAVRDERRRQLEGHIAMAPPDHDADPQPRLDGLPVEIEAARAGQAALAGRIAADDARRERRASIDAGIALREAEALVWRQLNELIGSADGAKFRRFAQSLTLDQLIGLANLQLRDLAPRYELQRAPAGELALQVVDRDMGDEVRGLANLSGGERFLLSLSLSLGLAELSSGKGVSVSSLFIDEGFGALDRDSLAQAIGVLEQLQASGRQVAVISHIEEVKERILVKIAVSPVGGGRSRVAVMSE